jgi:hypothetical protein
MVDVDKGRGTTVNWHGRMQVGGKYCHALTALPEMAAMAVN